MMIGARGLWNERRIDIMKNSIRLSAWIVTWKWIVTKGHFYLARRGDKEQKSREVF